MTVEDDARCDHPEVAELSPARRLGAALGRMDAFRRHRPGFADVGAADMRLLWLLVQDGSMTLAEVTEAVGLERSTVSRQVSCAVDAGLLSKARVRGSSAYRVDVTPEGRAAFERAAARALELIDLAMAEMGADAALRLVELVEEFVDVYGRQLADDPAGPGCAGTP